MQGSQARILQISMHLCLSVLAADGRGMFQPDAVWDEPKCRGGNLEIVGSNNSRCKNRKSRILTEAGCRRQERVDVNKGET